MSIEEVVEEEVRLAEGETAAGMSQGDVKHKVHFLDTLPIEEFPLFMKDPPKDPSANTPLSAIQALLYEGTPEEQALNFKNQGNECYQLGPKAYKDALKFYTRGIDCRCSDVSLNALLYLNRSAVNLALENWRDALMDAQMVLKLDPEVSPRKCHSRIAKAALQLRKLPEAEASFTVLKRLLDPESEVLIEIEEGLVKLRAIVEKENAHRQEQTKFIESVQKLVGTDCGVRVVLGAESDLYSQLGPDVDPKTVPTVHRDSRNKRRQWPIIFLYPSAAQSDFMASVDESTTLKELLQMVLSQVPEWDTKGEFKDITKLRVFYHQQLIPSEEVSESLIEVKRSQCIADLLGKTIKFIERGLLAFYIVPEGEETAKIIRRFPNPQLL